MIYYVPNMALEQAVQFSEELNKLVSEDSFTFDFSKMSNFDPLIMLVMGTIIRKYRQKYPNTAFFSDGVNDSNKQYAEAMGFFKYISEPLNEEKSSCESGDSLNYIPLTPILFDDLQKKEFEQDNYLEMGDIIEKGGIKTSKNSRQKKL